MIIQMLIGSLLVLFLPGLTWTYALFENREIDLIERIALALGLSLAMVPLSLFYLHDLAGMRIDLANSVYVVLLLTAVALCIIMFRRYRTVSLRKN
ncbi:DUF1616 domain-containing protein [uncultured Methanomethylovorans sp.]|jgi:uncharacterized membrane protein|uniref:DUF1616 domain-containing protein n=1 Tax=uncultured Methanomethylovorans sp. TaxID=183759 RepID=UPI00260DB6BD|nr:DUF1616 domain-containing protein [uncultured Methanomethylovorans sp.]